MTQEEINELKRLKAQNEILLEKLNGLQYKLQIREYEETLNPTGPGVAGPVSEPESVPVPVPVPTEAPVPEEMDEYALLDRYSKAAHHLRTERKNLIQARDRLNLAKENLESNPEDKNPLSDLASALRSYRAVYTEHNEAAQKMERYKSAYLTKTVGPNFYIFLQ